MTAPQFALIGAVGAPWIAAVVVFALGESRAKTRTVVGLVAGAVAVACSVLVGVYAAAGAEVTIGMPLLGFSVGLSIDRLGALFAVVATGLWLVTTVYATGYLSHGSDKARFFGFFAVCVGSAAGIALSANLLTLFVFYEALTLATYPLVVHSGSAAALKGGRTYLLYALTGGTVLALGVVWLYALGGGGDFSAGVLPAGVVMAYPAQLTVVFALLIAGFGVKAALFPVHGWLPAAMVAPAPVSALLHAVAVVKAGVFGIARVVLAVYGLETGRSLGVLMPLAVLASFTIVFASVRALAQDDIKKRLAYSTIGQLSYIVLGLAIGTPVAAAAAVAHLAHHAVLKITMFFTAGVLAEELKVYRVSQMDGVGRRMPYTMLAFSVAALGITGVPPIAGFVTKWGLGTGALTGGDLWPVFVLGLSTLLNAAYFMPMLGRAWFAKPRPEWASRDTGADSNPRRFEGDRRMVVPLVVTAAVGLALGPLAGASWAPASWAAATTGAPVALVVPWTAGSFGLDVSSGLFLILAAVVWAAAAIAVGRRGTANAGRFWTLLVLSAAGSVTLAFAQGPAVFYAAFSVMALASYGLVAHDGTERARSAGRAYLAFTLFAEVMLLTGLLIGSTGSGSFASVLAGSAWRDVGIAALVVAFGVKIGSPGLSGWMPGAYRSVPAGVGAALAGVVSSAGVVGLTRFMPGGVLELPGWGSALMAFGVLAAFYGALVGVVQSHPRHVMAYSSMSQFGLMMIGVGAGLSSAELWPAAVAAVGVYVVHHGFAKGALFMGGDAIGAAGSPRSAWLVVLPALALAGLPLTSGGIAKVALKGVTGAAPAPWAHLLETVLPLAAVGTTLLMARFIVLSWQRASGSEVGPGASRRLTLATWILLAFTGGLLWVVTDETVASAAAKSLSAHYLWILVWPVLVGCAVAIAVYVVRARLSSLVGLVPAGDIWATVMRWGDESWVRYQDRLATIDAAPAANPPRPASSPWLRLPARLGAWERVVLGWPVASALVVALALVVLLLAR